jgi:outer membrane immunogenic protein
VALPPPNPAPPSAVAVTPLPPASEPALATTSTLAPVPAPAPAPTSTDVLAQEALPAATSSDGLGQWTGLYVGGNFGYGFARGGGGFSCLNSVTNDTTGCAVVNSPALKTSGVFGGAQMGYLMPLSTLTLPLGATPSPVMIGIEGDIQGSGIDGRQNISGPINAVGFAGPGCTVCSFSASQSIDWFSTVRGRIGVPVDDVFIYATGGVMFGDVRASQTLNIGGGSSDTVTVKKTITGPVVGGGLEFNLSGPVTAKIEGLYYDLGTVRTASLPVGTAPVNFTDYKTFGYRGGMIRVGINVKLGGLGGS